VLAGQLLRIIAVVKGAVEVVGGDSKISITLLPGQFGLIPASLKGVEIKTKAQSTFLCVEAEAN